MRDEPLKKCPNCRKPGLKRLVGSGAGLIFKGTGFYITDYKNKSGGKPEGGGEGKPADAKPASPESKPATSDAKPATANAKPSSPAATPPSKPRSDSRKK